MTTWVLNDAYCSLTEEDRVARDRANALIKPIWEEKSRPENVVVLPLSAVPQGYRHFLSEGDRDAS